MDAEAEMSAKDMQNVCLILGILKYGQEFSGKELRRKTKIPAKQARRALNFLRKELYVIPRTVTAGKNKILVRYTISRRGTGFLISRVLDDGNDRKVAFTLSEKELKNASDFIDNHRCSLKRDPRTGQKKTGAIGGSVSWQFTSTSIGTAVTVSCACGNKKDVTDYDNW